ncbi:MAG: hypothetical protein MZW92_26970 [Comamonadaceae bacterium]|nr:hypothetical protein [Comamonadaceae bacterium]
MIRGLRTRRPGRGGPCCACSPSRQARRRRWPIGPAHRPTSGAIPRCSLPR